ncbi:MAG: hypothetical protein ACUVRZ_08560 [Desulfobacca sp.]|uniref:hypothetical protein n=1 Tax=Desulfobacca sp. TaxID=2067990 RepID=UPI004049A6D4
MGFMVFPALSSAQMKKQYQKTGVLPDQADSEAHSASIVLGLNFGSFSLGNDPCTRDAQNRLSPKSKYSDINLGKLPSKPSVQIGRSGQAMEGGDTYSAKNVCYEGYDSEGNKCVEATSNPDGSVTFKNTSEEGCIVEMGRNTVLDIAPRSEVTIESPKEPTTVEKIMHELGEARKDVKDFIDFLNTGMTRGQREVRYQIWKEMYPELFKSKNKGSFAGDRGNCDSFGITGGCRVDKGSAWIAPPWLNPMDEIKEAEKNGWVEKLKWQRVNPNPESPTIPPGGPTPSKTYPGESTKSGYRKEKESKVSKGEQITNPSGEKGTGHPEGFDLCGGHLPSPEECAKMGFDPERIIDPVDKSWNGRIEQVQNQRTLVWSKTMKRTDGSSLRVEKRYQNGSIGTVSYQFYSKDGAKIGYINYDAKSGKIEGVRLK